MMTEKRLLEILSSFRNAKITLIGDLFLDQWYEIDTALNEPSLETGNTAYQVVKKRSAGGAGGTVLNNLSALGIGTLKVVSFVGNDGNGWELLKHMKDIRVDVSDVIISDKVVTPSYIKPLYPVEKERFDIKNFHETPDDIQDALITKARSALETSDAVILLDQLVEKDTGVLTEKVRSAICDMALDYPNTIIFADSRAFIDRFYNVIIKCNNYEAASMTGRTVKEDEPFDVSPVFSAMDQLRSKTGKDVIITCNKYGVAIKDHGKSSLVPAVHHSSEIDICGAGDACTAGMVSALSIGAGLTEAAVCGNLSSGVTVRQLGRTGTADWDLVLKLFKEQSLLYTEQE